MLISTLKSKISYAKLTQTELYYEGSITIDEDTLDDIRTKLRSKVYRNKSHFFELAAIELLGKK